MSDLLNKKCEPCEGGVLPFDISEIHKYQKKVDGWDVKKNEKQKYFLEKNFKFKNFIFLLQLGDFTVIECDLTVTSIVVRGKFWSGSRESNPLPNRWQRFALPMS